MDSIKRIAFLSLSGFTALSGFVLILGGAL